MGQSPRSDRTTFTTTHGLTTTTNSAETSATSAVRAHALAAVLGLRGRQISVHAGAQVDVFKCTAILQSNEQSQKRIVPTYNSNRLNYVHEIKMTRLF